MKRRILATLLSLCLLVGLMPSVALAAGDERASGISGGIAWKVENSVLAISVADSPESGYDPGEMPDYVRAADQKNSVPWYSYLGEISEVTLNEGVKNIGDSAFYKAKLLTSITYQGNTNVPLKLGIAAIGGCSSLTNITGLDCHRDAESGLIFDGLNSKEKVIGFSGEVESVEIPDSVTTIGLSAFNGCTTLKSINLGKVRVIEDNAFNSCSNLTTITFPNTLRTIGDWAFGGGTGLTVLALPEGVVSIGTGAFGYSNLKEVILPNSIENIGNECFAHSTKLETVVLPENLKTVGRSMFHSCKALKSIKIPEGITTIEQSAFHSCLALEYVWLPTSLKSIGNSAFFGCTALNHINIPLGVETFGTTVFDESGTYLSPLVIYIDSKAYIEKLPTIANETEKVSKAVTNGGTFVEDTTFTAGTLATPTKDGAIFAGWYDNAEFTGEKVTNTANNKIYYAKWIGMDDIELQYGGEQTIAVSGVTLSGYQSDNPSVASVDETGKVTATGVGTATISATGTYGEQPTTFKMTVTVTPRVLTYTLAGGDTGSGSISYNYSGGHQKLSDYITFQWKDDPYTKVTLVEGTDINYTYTVTDSEGQGGGTAQTYDYLPMPVGNYDNVKFNLLNENYTFGLSGGGTRDYLEIDVHVVAQGSQRAYLASAWPKSDQNFVYTGEGVLPVEGTLNAYTDNSTSSDPVDIGTFTVNIEGLNDTSFHSEVSGISTGTDLSSISGLTLPTEPGTYIITASAANDSYYLYKSLVFTISKATVTVKADDKSVYVGDAMPELTYIVSGLASGDSLSGTVSLSCEATDTNTAGTYTITPSGGAVPNTEHYNSEIVYQSGTLTVSTRSSGGGGGSSSGGSSSSNVSGSGDDVSISASGGSVTSSQMESAVNKADEGSTITIKATSSITVSLPVGGMADAADNDNDVLLDLRYGEVTLSARAIAGMTDGVSSNDKIKVSVTSQTNSKDETISDLLDKGGAVFDVSVEVDGVEIHSFDGTLTITLTVSNLSKISDPHVLHILTDGTKEYYAPDRISGNTITVKGVRNLSTFAVIPGSEVPQTNPFTDVTTSDYYYDAVLWAVANGVTNGSSATTFSPNVAVSRAQMVTFLWRAHGSPEATGTNPFTDVSTSDYYYDAVLWAVANGVTNGTSATTFSPDAPVTRAQAVTFQWRAAGSPVVSGSSFGDVTADAYYVNAVTWAVANGITNGTSGTTFSPDVVVSRAQAVTFLHRELG